MTDQPDIDVPPWVPGRPWPEGPEDDSQRVIDAVNDCARAAYDAVMHLAPLFNIREDEKALAELALQVKKAAIDGGVLAAGSRFSRRGRSTP